MDSLHDINGFPMPNPQMMNHQPPPQVFGAFTTDGLPMNPSLDMSGQMFGDPGALMDDINEAKRRRIARVCVELRF
jgi:hypothetical protein